MQSCVSEEIKKLPTRYKNIIDRYNAGSSENEDYNYYEQLIKLIEELEKENDRADTAGLTEEELELCDLLFARKKPSQADEQKVSAKHLFKKLSGKQEENRILLT